MVVHLNEDLRNAVRIYQPQKLSIANLEKKLHKV